MKNRNSVLSKQIKSKIVGFVAAFLICVLFDVIQVSAQLNVDEKSLEAALKTLREKTKVPLRLPTLFMPPADFTPTQKLKPLSIKIEAVEPDRFAIEYCLEQNCLNENLYAEFSAEKITPGTDKPVGIPVNLAKGITGFFEEDSCGANCGHGRIFWEQDGFRYSIGLNVANAVETLAKFANSAINNDSDIKQTSVGKVSGDVEILQSGVLNDKAIYLSQPVYPATAKAANAKGEVTVEVLINKKGIVVEAKAISGNQLLRTSAEWAARRTKFKPVKAGGNAVHVKGLIVYNF